MEVRAVVRPGIIRRMGIDPIDYLTTRAPATWLTVDVPYEVVFVDAMLDEPTQVGGKVWRPEIPDDASMVQVVLVPLV